MNYSDLIYLTLKDIPEVYESWYRQSLDKTHVVFQQIEEMPEDYGDDDYESIRHTYRFDVFSKDLDEAESTKEAVKTALKGAGFIWQGTQFEYLSEIDYYHNSQKYMIWEE